MGTVFNRGTRDKPRWIAQWKDVDSKWKQAVLKGVNTKRHAVELLATIEANVTEGRAGIARPEPKELVGPLMESWLTSLTNRHRRQDAYVVRKHLVPVFGRMSADTASNVQVVLGWLQEFAAGGLAPETQRGVLGVLSRFWGWAVLRGHATANPVRMIPAGMRPTPPSRRDAPWIAADELARRVFHALPEPFNLVFYVGNRSGLRPGETCGLRLSDLDWLAEGALRVRHSRLGPLKEDKRGAGKVKWAPAPDELGGLLAPWVARRRLEGAGPEDLVFPAPSGKPIGTQALSIAWAVARKAVPEIAGMTLHEATRHSFASRVMSRGADLDSASAALGHATPAITRATYDHLVRKSFGAVMREGLGVVGADAAVVPITSRKI